MPEYSKVGPIARLTAAVGTPLLLTLAPHKPIALGVGVAAIACLIRMTLADGPSSSIDKEIEKRAAHDVIMTSPANRLVRFVLAATFAYAGVTFALRWVESSTLSKQLLAGDMQAMGTVSVAWTGCFVDSYLCGIWLATASAGQ